MNNDQVQIVLQYLKIETNYAIIINGQYGTGKTHFYKNDLIPKIKEICLPKDDRKKYTPIHISLFGYKSLEEIQTAIFIELYPILKSKGLKLAVGIGKSIIRGITQIGQLGDIDNYLGDLEQDPDKWLKYDDLVICFDDLDRKSELLDIKDIFGFINSLVENQGAKILIIANEEQLLTFTNYSSELREKVIGVSIQYKPDTKAVFSQIVSDRYSESDKVYFKFLEENSSSIIPIIEINQNNFRNLIFFLEHFKTVFAPIECLFQEDKEFAILMIEKLRAILDFTLAITIEYKLGLLNSTNIKEVQGLGDNLFDNFDIQKILKASNTEHEAGENIAPPYIEVFKTKYYSSKKYYFFKSIFDYITGSKAFSVENLKAELEGYFITKDGKIPEHEKVLQDLSYFGCLRLSDREYRRLTFQMIAFATKGFYQLGQYWSVFHFATRFNNILNLDFDKLKKTIKRGIIKAKSNFVYNQDLRYSMTISNETEYKDQVLEIINFCFDVNDSLNETIMEKEVDEIFQLFLSDFNLFLEKVSIRDNDFRFTPFWLDFNIRKTHFRIKKLDNDQIWDLGDYFKNRYRKNIYDKLFPEKAFVANLITNIDKPTIKRKQKNLLNASLDHLSKCLKESLLNFPE